MSIFDRFRRRKVRSASSFRTNTQSERVEGDHISERSARTSSRGYWLPRLRAFNRADGVVPGILNTFENQIIGSGLVPEPLNDDRMLNEEIIQIWNEWSQNAESTGRFNEYEAQSMLFRSWILEGEVFILHQRTRGTGRLPYQYRLLATDCVEEGGILRNRLHRPTTYRVNIDGRGLDVAANKVTHLATFANMDDVRGTSPMVPILQDLEDLNIIDTAERMSAKVLASLIYAVRRERSRFPTNIGAGDLRDSVQDKVDFNIDVGTVITDLEPGEDIEVLNTQRPSFNALEYRKVILRKIASAIACSYSTLARDYSGTYSSQRQEKVEIKNGYDAMFSRFCRRVMYERYDKFIEAGQLAGIIPNMVDPKMVSFRRPHEPWIDPQKEVNAYHIMLEDKVISRQQVVADLGGNWDTLLKELEVDTLGPIGESREIIEVEDDNA